MEQNVQSKPPVTVVKRIGIYIRVSTISKKISGKKPAPERNPSVQEQILLQFAARQRGWKVQRIYTDHTSSWKKEKPGLGELMADVQHGGVDVILVWRFDRFASTITELVIALAELDSLGVDFISIQDNLDTSTSTGKSTLGILKAMVTNENRVKRERVMAGMDRTRRYGTRSGKPIGRPRVVVDVEEVKKLRSQGLGWRRIGRKLKASHSTIRRACLNSDGLKSGC
jgi:DNA invertase Pin-like site-specific DNA recombinase